MSTFLRKVDWSAKLETIVGGGIKAGAQVQVMGPQASVKPPYNILLLIGASQSPYFVDEFGQKPMKIGNQKKAVPRAIVQNPPPPKPKALPPAAVTTEKQPGNLSLQALASLVEQSIAKALREHREDIAAALDDIKLELESIKELASRAATAAVKEISKTPPPTAASEVPKPVFTTRKAKPLATLGSFEDLPPITRQASNKLNYDPVARLVKSPALRKTLDQFANCPLLTSIEPGTPPVTTIRDRNDPSGQLKIIADGADYVVVAGSDADGRSVVWKSGYEKGKLQQVRDYILAINQGDHP